MTWYQEKHETELCECGLLICPPWMKRHRETKWHSVFMDAISMRDRGLTCAEIGRQLGMSRAYVTRMFRMVKKNARKQKVPA